MDSSVNINSEIINFKEYLSGNTDHFISILNSLENISLKAKDFLKSSLTKNDRIDNQLFAMRLSQVV